MTQVKRGVLDFFENPEKSVAIFLSSYMMTQGFHLYVAVCCPSPPLFDRVCSVTNTSCSTFRVCSVSSSNTLSPITFGLRARASLARSQNTIDIASQELICTSKISKALPDDINYASEIIGTSTPMLSTAMLFPTTIQIQRNPRRNVAKLIPRPGRSWSNH